MSYKTIRVLACDVCDTTQATDHAATALGVELGQWWTLHTPTDTYASDGTTDTYVCHACAASATLADALRDIATNRDQPGKEDTK